ncbi:hypothetical protein [Streptomyces nigrescens]|uniref:Uncharacterized protein n=1 Tax=Streptomyces nigrescens TaxID=1920 RepID=A0A640TGV1_STRNI|nr:hypothetical protein [Streptomyces libani]WAT96988.1 hypothetical protein STRLI_002870 [Streptomyces libani subsp. libani]GFE22414.1 hypothetical protein Sliba_28670 [Streptomyces libani subsp. libani]GGV90863.1 hypothetical protein GCM10010500_19490 [Streptomyces libani subsp. libani]
METIEYVVLSLNAVDDNSHHGGAGYDTGEREQLCEYIGQTVTEHGIDVAALVARRGIGRAAIIDKWRDWRLRQYSSGVPQPQRPSRSNSVSLGGGERTCMAFSDRPL